MSPTRSPLLAAALLLAPACRPEDKSAVARLSPDTLPLSGYQDLSIDLADLDLEPGAVTAARVGGILAYDLRPEGDTLTVTVQGAPEAGPATVQLWAGDAEITLEQPLTYAEPIDPRFQRLVVVGASLGMGVQSGVPNTHGQLHGPAAVLAAQLGAWVPPPLLVEGLFRQIEPEDLGPPPDCALPDITALAASAAAESMALMRDPDSGEFGFYHARIDPDIEVHNLAVGGSTVCDVVNGPGDFGENFVSALVYEPYDALGETVSQSQLDVALALAPTAVVAFDMTGNDLIDMVLGETLDPSLATPEDEYTACLAEFMGLADTGAEIWVANAPDVNALPYGQQLARRLVSEGTLSSEEVAALQDEISAVVERYNGLLAEAAAPYPNVHLVDVHARVETIRAEGLVVGEETLAIGLLGGLLSLDGLHFSDTGYAMLADTVTAQIAADLGLELPEIDLEAVLAADPYSPDALRAEGLEPGACE